MDMSFLLKSFLPPGVTVEQITEVAQGIAAKVVAAAQRIEENHVLLLEQNAMLRQVIANSQAKLISNEETEHARTPAEPSALPSPSAEQQS